ncbi:MAG: ATPase [Acidobacteriaceae bacterium]
MIVRSRPHVLAAILFFACLGAVTGVAPSRAVAQAQSQPPTQSQTAPTGKDSSGFISQKTANSQNLAKAEQEDEEYVFKHSASVRAFGHFFHLSPETASTIFWALNFLILVGFVGFFIVKALPKMFRERRQTIEKQLVEARVATERAQERLRVVEERLGRLDAEIAAVREHAEADSVGDEARIKATIEEERKKIVASAEQEIAAAGAAVERRLRRFAAELAVERATARLAITADDDRALVRDFSRGLTGDGSGKQGGWSGNGRSGERN